LKNQSVWAKYVQDMSSTNIYRFKSKSSIGLTILEILSLIVTVCLILVLFFNWFSTYRLKSKAAEASVNLKLIFQAEFVYYQNSQAVSGRNSLNTKQFLPLSPQPPSPGSTQQVGNFSSGDWSLLNISIPAPVYFSYSVETKGLGENATFTAIARGDLNGDQHFSRWEMLGSLNPNGELIGGNIVYSLDPLE
jgi:hypothetical protein